jgi:hypothetical protein
VGDAARVSAMGHWWSAFGGFVLAFLDGTLAPRPGGVVDRRDWERDRLERATLRAVEGM